MGKLSGDAGLIAVDPCRVPVVGYIVPARIKDAVAPEWVNGFLAGERAALIRI